MVEDQTAVQGSRRTLVHFGDTHIFSDSITNILVGFTVCEDEYEEGPDGVQTREAPYTLLYFLGMNEPIQLEGRDHHEFTKWYKQAGEMAQKRVELASTAHAPLE